MTSRTIDIHCFSCGRYMHSEMPESRGPLEPSWIKKHFCNESKCQEAKLYNELKGPEPIPKVDPAEWDAMMKRILARTRVKK